MSTHLLPLSPPQPAKKLRSCLSPSRASRSTSPTRCLTIRNPCSEQWFKRKCVRWQSEIRGDDVTCYFNTYSATEYDRTPLAPPSEQERECVLPARGARCLGFTDEDERDEEDEEEEEEEDDEPILPMSPFATPEDSDESDDERNIPDEWSDCFVRRRMMFARMCPNRDGPQFEGYRSLSSTLVDLLRTVDCDDEERVASREESDNEDDDLTHPSSSIATPSDGSLPISPTSPAIADLFSRLRESSGDCEIGTPSLVSSADSEAECTGLQSPQGSALDFLPGSAAPWKTQASFIHVEL